MPALDESLRTLFLAESTITDITATGPHSVEAIYCGDSPQKAGQPRLEIHELNLDPMLSLDGTSGMRTATIDIDCKARSKPIASNLADSVESYFNDYTGAAGSVTIDAVLLSDRTDSTESPDSATDEKLYVVTLDYDIQFTPS